MDRSPGFLHRSQLNFGFIAVILLTLGLDIVLVYLGYRLVTLIF